MSQLSDLIDHVAAELPLRPLTYRSSVIGYAGAPGGGSAPSVLSNCPAGSFYVNETLGVAYVKVSSSAWSSFPSVEAVTTSEFNVDVDPTEADNRPLDDGVIFYSQADADAWLAGKGMSAFKYMMDFFEVVPRKWAYRIRMNLGAGTHTNRPGVQYDGNTNTPLYLPDRIMAKGDPAISVNYAQGSLRIQGDSLSDWSVEDSGVCTGYQVLDEVTGQIEPYMDFAPGTFPNDGSLIGMRVKNSGHIIYDHTDSRLYLKEQILIGTFEKYDPNPIGYTIEIAQPTAIISGPSVVVGATYESLDAGIQGWFFQNFIVDSSDFNGSWRVYGVANVDFDDIDVRASGSANWSWLEIIERLGVRVSVEVAGCVFRDPQQRGTMNDFVRMLVVDGELAVRDCLISSSDGRAIEMGASSFSESSRLIVSGCVFVGLNYNRTLVYSSGSVFLGRQTNFPNLFLRCANAQKLVSAESLTGSIAAMEVDDADGDGLELRGSSNVLTDGDRSGLKTRSGGLSGAGLSFPQLAGLVAVIPADVAITGTAGDVRLPDGSVVTYASLVGGTAVDYNGLVERLT